MSNASKRMPGRRSGGVGRKTKNTFVTKSGQSIKINRSLTDRIRARRDRIARNRAQRLAGMPKSRIKRFFYRLHPKRMYKYWFSREGGIMALKVTGIGLISGFLILVGLFAYFRKYLPNLRDISGRNIGGSIRYYDRTDKVLLWEDFDAIKRINVEDKDIAEYVKQATIAIEDKDFFKHGGFDVRGITRAAWNNAFGGSTQGGSTITQQLVRLTQAGVGNEQTYTRKVKEVILSVELERSYSKQEILVGYLNTAPYGNVQVGVESAARDYFQKSAKQLTLDEAAFLAAIPKSPSYYSPYGPNYDEADLIGRQHYILDLMEQQGMITREQRDAAKKVPTTKRYHKPKQKFSGIKAPWFVQAAKESLEEEFSAQVVKRGGWRVTTTLDLNLQKIAEEQVQAGLEQVRRQGGDVAAFTAEDVKTGQVVAMVGGSDFNNKEYGQVNYAREKLPPGSSFKPYDYAALIEKTNKFGAGSVLYDNVGPLPGYPCTNRGLPAPRGSGNCLQNYDFRSTGPLTLRYALGGSRNIPAVKAMLITGVDQTREVAQKLGLRSGYNCYSDEALTKEKACFASSAIGDGAYLKQDEHVHAYASLSRNGKNIDQAYILKIEDAGGKKIDEWKPEEGEQAIREDAAYIISDILSDPNASYLTSKPHRFQGNHGTWKFAMKTGTTNDSKDGWLMGYSAKYAAGVWVGHNKRQIEMSGFMENMTRPIWEGWMKAAHRGLKPEEWKKPATLKSLPAYVVRSHVGLGSVEPSPSTDLFPTWFQQKKINTQSQTIDIVSNRLATECTPGRAKKVITGGDANSFSGDQFVGGGASANTTLRDHIHKCTDIKPAVRLSINPAGGKKYQLVADVTQGTHPFASSRFPGTVTFQVGGQTVKTVQINGPGTVAYTYTATSGGAKQVRVIVVDGVLYDSSDTGTFTAGGSLSLSSATAVGFNTIFSWSGGSGTVTVYRASDNEELCDDNDSSCQTNVSDAPIGTQVYARDNDGNQSATVTVSGP